MIAEKENLIKDMHLRPFQYRREEVYELVGIHVVITKSDLLPSGVHVDEWLLKQGYGLF